MKSPPQNQQSSQISYMMNAFDYLYAILTILYCSYCIVWMISIKADLESIKKSDIYNQTQILFGVWKMPPPDLIYSTQTQCQDGDISLVRYNWTGTKIGCSCHYDDQHPDLVYVLPRNCTDKLINDFGCSIVDPMKSMYFTRWRNVQICYKPSLTSLYNENTDLCTKQKSGRICGQGYSRMCLNKTQRCPINEILVSNQQQNATFLNASLGENGLFIHYGSNESNSFPIIDFKVDEYSFCDGYDQGITPGRVDYVLMQSPKNICSSQNMWQYLDEQTEQQFYLSNNRTSTPVMQLPGYPLPSQFVNYSLGFRTYPKWNYECRANSQYNLRQLNHYTNVEKGIYHWKHFAITTSVSIFFQILFVLLIILENTIQLRNYAKSQNPKGQAQDLIIGRRRSDPIAYEYRLSLIKQIWVKLVKYSQLASLIIGVAYFSENSQWFQDAQNLNCLPEYLEYLYYFQQKANDNSQLYKTMLIIFISMVCFDAVVLSFQIFYLKKIQKKEPRIFRKPSDKYSPKKTLTQKPQTMEDNEQFGDSAHLRMNEASKQDDPTL